MRGVTCQVHDSTSCSITPATCTASCNGTGGVIVCNGQVVYVAATIADAGQWYIAHLDAQFDPAKFVLSITGGCTGDQCTSTAKVGCAMSPGTNGAEGTGVLLAGLAFAGLGMSRRRKGRR